METRRVGLSVDEKPSTSIPTVFGWLSIVFGAAEMVWIAMIVVSGYLGESEPANYPTDRDLPDHVAGFPADNRRTENLITALLDVNSREAVIPLHQGGPAKTGGPASRPTTSPSVNSTAYIDSIRRG